MRGDVARKRSDEDFSQQKDLWDDYTGHQIFLVCSSDLLELYSPSPPTTEAVRTKNHQDASCAKTPVGVRRGAGTTGGPIPSRGQPRPQKKRRCLLLGRQRAVWTIHPQAHNSQSSHSWQTKAGNEEPSPPPPRPTGPCATRCSEHPSPPAEELTHHPPGHRFGGGAVSSASSSEAFPNSDQFPSLCN